MRLVSILLLALLIAPVADAQAVQPGTVWTVFTTVDAAVRDNYATVKVIADIRNQGPDPEFPFVVRIPDDAFVTGLTIERDGQVFEAEIKEREEARQEYEEWKAQQQTGGLVEKTRRTNVFSYLINVAEFTNVQATLTYERYLAAENGVYNLSLEAPVSGFGRDLGARFQVRVVDGDGVVALWGEPTATRTGDALVYEVGPRPSMEPTPFTAAYMLDATDGAGTLLTTVVDGKGYFAHRFRAPQDAQELPMDLVMVLDVSGSMAGQKLTQMVDAAKQVVQSLHDEDRLHLVAFSSNSQSPWSGLIEMTPENRRRAAREIDALFDGGGTNIEAGLRRGFDAFSGVDWTEEEGRFPALILLTDGQPTAGVTSRSDLRELASNLNARGVPVFGIAFGDDADFALVRALAQDADGAAVRVPLGTGAEVDLRRFMASLTTPVLRDVEIAYSRGVQAHEPMAPILFGGSELLVVGTFDPAWGIHGNVTGVSPEGERRYAFAGGESAPLGFLPRLVAYHEVRMLEEQLEAEGGNETAIARVVELALEHGFVTDHTSLVVTLPPRELREFTPTAQPWQTDASGAPVPTAAPTTTAPQGTRWSPFDSTSEASADGRMIASPTANGPAPTSEPQVPGPGAALVVLAVVAAALVVARRR